MPPKTPKTPPRRTAAGRLPGDLDREALIARMIRVNHAGEFGAKRIYQGQLSVLGDAKSAPVIQQMADQEQQHLDTFEQLIIKRRVRPTLLSPLWHVAGFALGAATAALGERAAMACTVAVEEVIDEHYAAQQAALGDDEQDLRETIGRIRADEVAHHDIALAHEAELAPGYEVMCTLIKRGSRIAIWLSSRL